MTTTTPTTKTHAICHIDGHFAGQALLTDSFQLGELKAYARARQNAGRDVTLRKGAPVDVFTSVCRCCGEEVAWDPEDLGVRCTCGAMMSGANSKLGIAYSWMSAAEVDAANAWYEQQDAGGFGW